MPAIQTPTQHEMSFISSVGSAVSFVSVVMFLFVMWQMITSNRQILFLTHTRNSAEWLQNFPPAEHSYSELPFISVTN